MMFSRRTRELGGLGDSGVEQLKTQAPAFMQRLTIMRDDAVRTGNADAQDMVGYGENLKSVIETFTGALDTASNIGSSIVYGITHPFGIDLSSVVADSTIGGINKRLGGLGVLPAIIPLAAIATSAAAVAAISYYITSADRIHGAIISQEWQQAQAQAEALRASGDVAGAQAVIDKFNAVQASTAPQSIGGMASTLAGAAVIVALAYIVMKRVK